MVLLAASDTVSCPSQMLLYWPRLPIDAPVDCLSVGDLVNLS